MNELKALPASTSIVREDFDDLKFDAGEDLMKLIAADVDIVPPADILEPRNRKKKKADEGEAEAPKSEWKTVSEVVQTTGTI